MLRRLLPITFLLAPTLATAADRAGEEFFERRVRPVLAEHCLNCHGPKKQQGGLRLDSPEAFRKGGDSGPTLVTGEPTKGLFLQAIRHDGDLKMPPKGKLPPETVDALHEWVKRGAPWPSATQAAAVASKPADEVRHWAFQPVVAPPVPAVKDAAWVRSPVDPFVLAKLEAAGVAPSPPADRPTLLRRLTFDLHGLPPTAEEVAAFVADTQSGAVERVVDRLLASPRYGERWARHWLDVARYADTKGYVFQEERRYAFAYTYRDYVVKAFNYDLPYDRFVQEQLAADRLPDLADPSHLAALGFLTVGRRFLNNVHDIADDRIDVVSRGLLGLTVSCARCHDHKFDPIPTRDYYAFHGIFTSSEEPKDLPMIGKPAEAKGFAAFQKRLDALTAEHDGFLEKKRQEQATAFRVAAMLAAPSPLAAVAPTGIEYVKAIPLDAAKRRLGRRDRDALAALKKKADTFQATAPNAPPRAMVLTDMAKPHDSRVFVRGNPGTPGAVVPRHFLTALGGSEAKPFRDGSGRLDLARAIGDPANPLTARVLVNRVWAHHVGVGLVDTPSDFGVRTPPPSHPELLDDLAARFVRDGWSLKKLHRTIVLSNTYRQRSDARPDLATLDPENRLLARMNRQRLDWEALRDGLLAVSGTLDATVGGPAVDLLKEPFSGRRTLYGYIDRQNLPGLFRTFDLASPDAHAPQRFQTTVPQQALALMNSPFVQGQARALAKLADKDAAGPVPGRIDWLHRRLFGREAAGDETQAALDFLEAAKAGLQKGTTLTPWEQYVQVLMVSNEFAFVD